MDTELTRSSVMESNGAAKEPARNGDRSANRDPAETDCDALLSVHVSNGNGDLAAEPYAPEQARNADRAANGDPGATAGDALLSVPSSAVCRIKKELTEVVFWKVQLWKIIIFILLVMVAVIMISLALCTVIHKDVDDEFDSSLFKFPRYFNGSFQMPNMVPTEDLYNLSSNESQNLTADLQKKLSDVYSSSNALGRYFSRAEITAFRNGSDVTDYRLMFVLPEEEKESIGKFIVCREIVYNVLRQFLYDQEDDGLEYIDPRTLTMFLQDV
ncbi:TPA-induced transmembrane protein isoform X2 [Gouania willdenowi]|uniref:TPA-induced transmembrane protein isoform X2 n=1 Tax=Gouania willdenowi TaxID=441366 RepID=UPI0010568CAB|nr:TPA-induced transmembrane protein isoform X2 [Gouania willdenowi]